MVNKKKGWGFILVVLIILGLSSIFIAGIIGLFITEPLEIGNVAVIEIKGPITSIDTGSFGVNIANADDIIKNIEKAKEDEGVKGVIFLINSPGGTAVASDEIAREIKDLNKTNVAVIRDTGASGAYWIASSTEHIIANPMSFTGSIGVIGSYLEFADFIADYNISYRRLAAGKYKDMGSPFKKMTNEEKAIFQDALDEIHNEFIMTIAENRGMDIEKVKNLATGQFYTGRQALSLGLVDELGTIRQAEDYIKEKENLEDVELAYYKKPKTLFNTLMSAMDDFSFNIGKGIGSSFDDSAGVRI